MTPNDVPGPIITAESLQPWLIAIAPALDAIAPALDPVRPLTVRPIPAPAAPLRPAA